MKYLGIDYGSKNIGLATSDEEGRIAFPKIVLKNDLKLLGTMRTMIFEEAIKAVVIGYSVDANGKENLINNRAKEFAEVLKKEFGLQVFFEKEHFSSFEAHTRQGKDRFNDRKTKIEKTSNLDARAAAIILQRYLDKNFH